MEKFHHLGRSLSKLEQQQIRGGGNEPGIGTIDGGEACNDPGENSYDCTVEKTDGTILTETSTGDTCGCAKQNYIKLHSNVTHSVNCC